MWEEALARRDEAGYGRIDLLFTIRKELHAPGAGDARWWRPGRAAAPLVELLGWGEAPVLDAARIARTLEGYRPPPRRTGAPPSRAARAWATGGEAQPVLRRLDDLALVTSPAEKTLIEWAARHPLLSAAELAALTGDPAGLIRRRLERLAQLGAIGADAESVETGRNSRVNTADDLEPRYLLTELGMRWLAARAGVPPAIFARHGGVTFASGEQSCPRRVVRHREHTLGVNRFAARLALDAMAAGWRLAEWRNEAESTHRFVAEDGRIAWIRPDASGVLVRGAEARPFLLEYDRGTLDSGDYRAKFEGYRRYYAAGEWEDHFPREPALLFVCSDHRAEARVGRAVNEWTGRARVFVAAEWRIEPRGGTSVARLLASGGRSGEGGNDLDDQRSSLKRGRLRRRSGDTQLPGLAPRARPLTGGDR